LFLSSAEKARKTLRILLKNHERLLPQKSYVR